MTIIAMLIVWSSIVVAALTSHLDTAICIGTIAFFWLMTRKGEKL